MEIGFTLHFSRIEEQEHIISANLRRSTYNEGYVVTHNIAHYAIRRRRIPQTPEFEVTTTSKTSDDVSGSSIFDDRSVVADEESREANDNEVGGEQTKEIHEELSRTVLFCLCNII
ncbi:hypothetical protein L1987_80381 [Smallanthus sonchifolius]|uniref:Uncharacterized protein n=1 Tax=Smallanthus sonchifolius TaxID=185202 RepID=A0ACB8YN49_9ASTR|nr:hypothetical protein L1987_80381 [Smallanthus sonchifolius]